MLGNESIISNICRKNENMETRLFTADMKLAEIIHIDYRLLLLLPRFGMSLGFGDKTVQEWCDKSGISCRLFLMICNVYNCEQYLPGEKEIEEIDVNQLIAYLQRSHLYYLDNRLDAIERELQDIGEACPPEHRQILKRFFEGYKNEVISHFDYEEKTVIPYILDVTGGSRPEDYRIEVFKENHSNIDDKLNDLKNIIMKYLQGSSRGEEKINLLFDIFSLEEDLSKHSLIEDKILVPFVLKLEQRYDKD